MRKKTAKEMKDNMDDMPTVKSGTIREKKKREGLKFGDRRRLKRKPETSYLVKMRFSNGVSRDFVVSTNEETFNYKGREYHLRKEEVYFNLSMNQFELIFYDDEVEPVQRRYKRDGDSNYFVVKPENMKGLVGMNYVKVLANSSELDKHLKAQATMMFIVLILSMMIAFFSYRAMTLVKILIQSGVSG